MKIESIMRIGHRLRWEPSFERSRLRVRLLAIVPLASIAVGYVTAILSGSIDTLAAVTTVLVFLIFVLPRGYTLALTLALLLIYFKPLLYRILFYISYFYAGRQLAINDSLFDLVPGCILASLGVLGTVTAVTRFPRGKDRWSTVDRALLLYIAFASALLLVPGIPATQRIAGYYAQILLVLTMYFAAGMAVRRSEDFYRIFMVFIFAGTCALLYGLYQYFVGLPVIDRFWFDTEGRYLFGNWFIDTGHGLELRYFSVSTGETDFLFPLVVLGILAMGMLGVPRVSIRHRGFLFVMLSLLAFYLALTLSRSPLAMAAVGAAIFSVVRLQSGRRWLAAILLLVATLILANAFSVLLPSVSHNQKLQRFLEVGNPFAAASVQERSEVQWQHSMRAFLARPFSGWGIGAGSWTRYSGEAMLVAPHNDFLLRLVEGGLGYLLLFICLLAAVARALWQGINSAPPGNKPLHAASLAALVAFVVGGMFNLPLTGGTGAMFLWFLIGGIRRLATIEATDVRGGERVEHPDG